MHEQDTDVTSTPPASSKSFPFLVALFVGSGAAALIYEIVWFQLLSLWIGASSVSLGVLLGTFMGGMCLGSLLLPRLVSPRLHPLRLYAFLELGIAIIGILILYAMPLIGTVYTAWAGSGLTGLALRSIVAAICLLPPTVLMGATLPAIARWVETTPKGVSWLGFFYGGNIVGAVVGSLLAGYYLLPVHDVQFATFAAVAINVSVALLALLMSRLTAYTPASVSGAESMSIGSWPVYVTIGLSGMTALGAEVIWTRHLSLLLGATVYTFSLVLAVFLMGLGIGSSAGAALARSVKSPRAALGLCQLLLCVGMAWAAYTIAKSLPYWPFDVTALPYYVTDPGSQRWISLQIDLVRSIWTMLPAAVLWGASFPLALAAAASRGQDPGRLVGGLYAANTVGAIVGSLGSSLILITWLGTQTSQKLLIAASAVSALLMLVPISSSNSETRLSTSQALRLVAAMVVVVVLVITVPALPGKFVAFGRFLPSRGFQNEVRYVGEGLTASVAVTEEPGGILNYHNAGKVQASSWPQDMRLQRMLGGLTTLVPRNNQSFLVIGLGAGITAGEVSINPDATHVAIAEIEPLVPQVVSQWFGDLNYDVVENPRVEVHIDDGRHFLLTTDETFDGITSDPLDPWVKGAAALYTKEFWETVKERLNPGGVATVFVQLYESTEDAVKSEVATFLDVFPDGAVFANTISGQGYDVVLFGRKDTTPIDTDLVIERFADPAYSQVVASLREVGFYSATDLLSTFAGQKSDLDAWLEGAQINRDRNLRLQYLAGQGLNYYRAEDIFNNMIAPGLAYPEGLFTGTPETLAELQSAIAQRQGRF
jgi:spermidine synthase